MRLPCATAKEAIRLRHEINALRAAMRDQNRTDWQRFYSAGLYIDPKDPRTLIIRPKENEFKSVLDAAGVPEIAEPPPTVAPTEAEPADQRAIDAFLADLKNLRH